jgi:ADP-ribose pyrophosphatase YjhB (NUDIX family)
MSNQIRPLAICLFRQGQRILVAEGYDPVKGERFYRPLGGGIEFWERGEEAIRRELREEIQAEVDDIRYLFTLENIYTFNGEKGHEIALVYDGRLRDASLYAREAIDGLEYGQLKDQTFRAVWKDLEEFGEGKERLYPDGLLEALHRKSPA